MALKSQRTRALTNLKTPKDLNQDRLAELKDWWTSGESPWRLTEKWLNEGFRVLHSDLEKWSQRLWPNMRGARDEPQQLDISTLPPERQAVLHLLHKAKLVVQFMDCEAGKFAVETVASAGRAVRDAVYSLVMLDRLDMERAQHNRNQEKLKAKLREEIFVAFRKEVGNDPELVEKMLDIRDRLNNESLSADMSEREEGSPLN